MKQFVSPRWTNTLAEHGLTDFDFLWGLDVGLLDSPNTGRGRDGWSSVGLLRLDQPGGREKRLILKRQHNYVIRTLSHPFRGIPTLRNEAQSILQFNKLGIPAMELVLYAERRESDGVKAILLTEFLSGYESLERLYAVWQKQGWPKGIERHSLIRSVAQLIKMMHAKGMRHNSLYPKHVFVRNDGIAFSVKLIDLEKVRWSPIGNAKSIRDLDSLNRHAPGWSRADRLRFFKSYCQTDRFHGKEKRLYKKIAGRSQKGT